MSHLPKVAIFWDYENCSPPSSSSGLGFDIVNNIGRLARLFGSITSFRAYLDVSVQSSKSVYLRSELQSSGLSIIDCPHNGKKDVVDKMILVDMLAFAVDHPSPATIFLITGDRDYAYAVSTLKLRNYQVILVVPSSPHTSPSLESQASIVIDWGTAVLRSRTEQSNSSPPLKQPYPDLDPALVNKLLRELRDSPDDPDTLSFQGPSRLRRVTARDLLEPLRHSKSESLDSAQDFINTTKHTSTASEGGLPIPKTPLRSRHTSLSTGSTRPRSATNVSQSPPTVEHYTPTKKPQPRRPSTSDLEKRNLSVLTSLSALELPLHDDRPPSSIIIRSPLEPARSTCDAPRDSSNPSVPPSHKLNCLASPFVMSKSLTGSISNEDSHTTIKPTSQTQTLATSVCRTPQMKDIDIEVRKEIECPTGLEVESEGNFEQSIPHRVTPDLATSTHLASHTTHSLSDRNVDLHDSLTAAGFLGIGDGDASSQFAAVSCTSNAQDCSASGTISPPSPSASPSAPSTTAEFQDEDKRCQIWTTFKPLIHHLLAARQRGIDRPSRSIIAVDLLKSDKQVYQRAGVSRFKDYTALAELAGVIELGGKEGDAWIALHPNWFGMDGMTTTPCPSNRLASPTFEATPDQDPLLTGSEMIETATSFQTPGPRSSDTSPALPTTSNRQDSASYPAHYQPLIDTLVRMHAEGFDHPRRSLVGQALEPIVYSQAGVSGFKEYIHRASEAQLVEFGGVGGYAWIKLHPDLEI